MTYPPPVVALAELAKVHGVSRVRAMQLIKKAEFPAPIAVRSVGRIWCYDAVVEYCESTGRKFAHFRRLERPAATAGPLLWCSDTSSSHT
jgi:predicted DNA-binding transcriptional regulator AlpA